MLPSRLYPPTAERSFFEAFASKDDIREPWFSAINSNLFFIVNELLVFLLLYLDSRSVFELIWKYHKNYVLSIPTYNF